MIKVRPLLAIQTTYYTITALWAILHINSFMWVTGPKTDVWLVKVFSLLLLAVCIGFFMALKRGEINVSVAVTAFTISIFLLVADVYYFIKGDISYVYLTDGAIQFILACCWAIIFTRFQRKT